MEIIDLRISEMLEFCEVSNLPLNELSDEIQYYLKTRISRSRFCTKEEIDNLFNLSKCIKAKFSNDEKIQNKLLKEVQDLVLISQDQLHGTNNYSKIKKLKNKKKKGLSGEEYYSYAKLILDNVSSCLSLSMIENLFNECFSKISSKSDFVELLSSYDYSDFIKQEKIQINDMIDYMKYDIEKIPVYKVVHQFMRELGKKKISYMNLDKYLMKMQTAISPDILVKDFSLLKDALEYFNENKYLQLKIDDLKNFPRLQNKAYLIYENLMKLPQHNYDIKKKLASEKIVLTKDFSSTILSSVKVPTEVLEMDTAPRIVTIDTPASESLDGAFSIQKFDDVYVLCVYIADVPVFLKDNWKLCKESYRRGNSIYIKDKSMLVVPMLPNYLSKRYLSLNLGSYKNAIVFTFVIGKNGQIYSKDVSRKKIKVTHKLTPNAANQLLVSKSIVGIEEDLIHYRDVYHSIIRREDDIHLADLREYLIHDFIAFPSVLVNYYVGHEAEFAIYRQNGKYTKNFVDDSYTHSVTPLRKFVSDINLAFFLHQKGIVNFREKDLNYVDKNIEEIIHHLNEQDALSKFAENNPAFVKKYIR